MDNHLSKIGLFFRTISALSLRQLYFRLIRIVKFRWLFPWLGPVLFPIPERKKGSIQRSTACFQRIPEVVTDLYFSGAELDQQLILADRILKGRVEIINLAVQFEGAVDWNRIPEGDPLWNYQLHYFDWANPLVVGYLLTGENHYQDRWIDLLEDWIRHNPPGKGLGWHPYPTSRRIQNWLRACAGLNSLSEKPIPEIIVQSILQQAGFLSCNFEHDLQNNHIIANAAALAWAGTVFKDWKDSPGWRKQGYDTLWREFLRQVNEEGFHAERSPTYQLIVQGDVAETALLADQNHMPIPLQVVTWLQRMEAATDSFRRPDGLFPLLNDSVSDTPDHQLKISSIFNFIHPPGTVSAISGTISQQPEGPQLAKSPLTSTAYPETGYVIFRDGEGMQADYLVFDCGSMGPVWNPGHGHAGALGFELYAVGKPLIVDPGTYTYHQQPWRNYFRSTRSHNTMVVDGMDQSELWGSFRVGRMASCRLLEWDLSGTEKFAVAEHDGYLRLPAPVMHRRKVIYRNPHHWRVIDQAEGSGCHKFEIYFHFPPDANLVPGVGNDIRVEYGAEWALQIKPVLPGGSDYQIDSGWISKTWYQKQSAPVLCYRWEGYPAAEWTFDLFVAD